MDFNSQFKATLKKRQVWIGYRHFMDLHLFFLTALGILIKKVKKTA